MRKGDEKRGKGGMRPIASLFSRIAEPIGGGRNEKRKKKKFWRGNQEFDSIAMA